VTLHHSPAGLANLYADMGRELAPHHRTADALASVARAAATRVPGVEWASVTRGHKGSFVTVAATDPAAHQVDQIQYDLGTGPCVDAILQETVFLTGDLGADRRWPEFGQRALATAGVHSMLSFRLFLEEDDLIAGLNLYATQKDAFDDDAQTIGTLVATHGALAISAAAARELAAHLQRALQSNRDIGVAMGVLMTEHKITRSQAFDLLRIASQNTNRRLADIAVEVGDTGTLDLPGQPHPRRITARTPQRAEPTTPPDHIRYT
jgi:transcriptional regulator with GAF, ATPase, and Fis domain